MLRGFQALALAGLTFLATSGAIIGQSLTSVSIVDDPVLPLEEWGYEPALREVAPGTWVTWSNAG